MIVAINAAHAFRFPRAYVGGIAIRGTDLTVATSGRLIAITRKLENWKVTLKVSGKVYAVGSRTVSLDEVFEQPVLIEEGAGAPGQLNLDVVVDWPVENGDFTIGVAVDGGIDVAGFLKLPTLTGYWREQLWHGGA